MVIPLGTSVDHTLAEYTLAPTLKARLNLLLLEMEVLVVLVATY